MIEFLRRLRAWLKHGTPERLRIESITMGSGGAYFSARCIMGANASFSVSSLAGFQAGDVVYLTYGPSPLRKAWKWWGLK